MKTADAFGKWLKAEELAPEARKSESRNRLGNAALYGGGAALVSYALAASYGTPSVVLEAAAIGAGLWAAEKYWFGNETPLAAPAVEVAPPTQVLLPQMAETVAPLAEQIRRATGCAVASTEQLEGSPGVEKHLVRFTGATPAVDVISKVTKVAAELDVSTEQVRLVPDPLKRSARELGVTVYETNPWDRPISTLGKPRQRSIFDGIDLGVDVDGNPYVFNLIGRSVLIGGVPDSGKTVTAMTILAQLACDPRVRLWVADPKGVDMPSLITICYRYVGRSQQACLDMLEDLHALGQRKLDALAEAGAEKMTREVVDAYAEKDPTSLLAGIDVVYMDEFSEYSCGSDSALSADITARVQSLIQLYRCAGIHIIIATQRPSAKVIDTAIRDLMRVRIAHECGETSQSNMILGGGAAGAGWSAKGIGENPGVALVYRNRTYTELRTHYTDPETLEAYAEFGADIRTECGTMPERLDDSSLTEVPLLLSEVYGLFDNGRHARLSTADVIEKLRENGSFPVITPQMLAQRMSGFGATPRPLGPYGAKSTNVRGYRWIDVEAAYVKVKDAIASSSASR